jgi:hypothetical protein
MRCKAHDEKNKKWASRQIRKTKKKGKKPWHCKAKKIEWNLTEKAKKVAQTLQGGPEKKLKETLREGQKKRKRPCLKAKKKVMKPKGKTSERNLAGKMKTLSVEIDKKSDEPKGKTSRETLQARWKLSASQSTNVDTFSDDQSVLNCNSAIRIDTNDGKRSAGSGIQLTRLVVQNLNVGIGLYRMSYWSMSAWRRWRRRTKSATKGIKSHVASNTRVPGVILREPWMAARAKKAAVCRALPMRRAASPTLMGWWAWKCASYQCGWAKSDTIERYWADDCIGTV